MPTTTVQPQLPVELQRQLDQCHTNAQAAEVLILWGYEHGFRDVTKRELEP